MSALETAVAATIERLRVLDESERLQRVRWQAYQEMAAEGKSHREISMALTEALAARGLNAEEIRAAGVSDDSILVVLARLKARIKE